MELVGSRAQETLREYNSQDLADTVWALADYEGQLLSGSSDCTIKVWNKETWKCDATLMGHVQAVHAILPLPTTGEGGSFISASWDHSIAVWQ